LCFSQALVELDKGKNVLKLRIRAIKMLVHC
jgi:hypothetical protein